MGGGFGSVLNVGEDSWLASAKVTAPSWSLSALRALLDLPALGVAGGFSLLSAVFVSENIFGRPYTLLQDADQLVRRWHELAILGALLLAWLLRRGHYNQRIPFWTETREIVHCVVFMALLDSFLQYATKDSFSRLWLLQYWTMVGIFLVPSRAAAKRLLDYAGFWQLRTLLVASRNDAQDVAAALRSEPRLGYDVVGILDPATGFMPAEENVVVASHRETTLTWSHIKLLCRHLRIDNLVLAFDAAEIQQAQGLLRELVRHRISYSIVPPVRGVAVQGLDAQHFFSHDVILLRPGNNLARPFDRMLKRFIDVVVAGSALVFLAPGLLVLAGLLRRDGGTALFGQWRIGMNGRRFRCLKFRTMVVNSDVELKSYLAWNGEAAAEWAQNWKLRSDPRVTPLGRFLRKSSIDELPQLINVLKGEMSLVGPRPIVEREVHFYGEDIGYYYQVRPGITGLWQVSGRVDTGYHRRVALDCWYVRNWSLWHDIAILFGTVPAVLRQEGAY